MLNEIKQLCKFTFNYSNMNTSFIDKESKIKLEYGLNKIPEVLTPYFAVIINKLELNGSKSEYKVIHHTNSYKINYISAKVFDNDNYIGSIVIGPYLLEEPTILMVESVITSNKMAISLKNIVRQYYLSLPLIGTQKANDNAEFLSYLVSTFHSDCFKSQCIGSLNYNFKTEYYVPPHVVKQSTEQVIEDIEKRYGLENEMLHAVESGNKELFEKIVQENTSSVTKIPDRIPNDPLRSLKNYGFVLNTLLRKAAEKGGVHPIYLDSMSSKYAVQVEKCNSIQQLKELFKSIQIGYCDAVRKLSLKDYSPLIRKAIEFIRINLNQELSLDSISQAILLSPYELSRQFKKETGETITEYINKRRINEAIYILENQDISITDVSFMVGFNDVNYFTKVFKKIKGVTPTEYRKNKI